MSDSDEIETTEEVKAPEEEMDVDSFDSDSSSDADELLEKRARELESQISEYVYSYDAHVELVSTYKKLCNLPQMRAAYERFHKHFPLTATLWLDWIRDEMRIASSETEKKYVLELFDKAVEDYLSVDLWLEYVQFCIGQCSVDEARKVFEKAINIVGLHVGKGSLVWDAYREFELAYLALQDEGSDAWKEQASRVYDVFRRQLSVPQLDMERTYVEFRVWVERLPSPDFVKDVVKKDQVDYAYKKAKRHLEDCEDFEQDLLNSEGDAERVQIYKKYIASERKSEHLRCLYERLLADSSLDAEIWLEYCMYFFKLGNFSLSLTTSERSLRNCPWSEELWVFNMRILELADKGHDDITRSLEKALSSGFQSGQQYLQVWLAYLDHYRRVTDPKDSKAVEKLREAFQKGHQHLTEAFGVEADPECTLLRLWARIEAGFLHDITACRKIWNDYGVLNALGNSANVWLELIQLEQQYGDDKHLQKTYQRALSSTKDWPQCIVQSWILYERQFGSAESLINCSNSCREFLKKYHQEHPVEATHEVPIAEASGKQLKKYKTAGDKNFKDSNKRKFQQAKNNKAQEKTRDDSTPEKQEDWKKRKMMKVEESEDNIYNKLQQVNLQTPERKSHSEEEDSLQLQDSKRPQKRRHSQEEDQNQVESGISKDDDQVKQDGHISMSPEKQQRSIFISNLDYGVSEEDLRTFISVAVEELRLVKDRKGHSKGYAYCVLTTKDDAQKLLSRDRELLNSRPVFISECKIDRMQREPQFRYATSQEKHKLFIKGLPLSMSQDQVQSLFEVHGELKDVRLVTYRNGRSKGLAYVEFKNENDAAKAIIATDNKEVDGFTISVAISDPPKRKTETVHQEPMRHSKSRLGVPLLVPRSVQAAASKAQKPSMTNEDFRKLLSNK